MKKNGFRRPYHKLQLLSWVYTFFVTGSFSFLALPFYTAPSKALLILLFSILLFLVLTFGFLSTYIDPTDPAIKETVRAELLSKAIDYKKYPKICKICKHHVNLDTKHCRECERCVLHFDHHCKWLNNCIGIKNYRHYYILLVVFELFNCFVFVGTAVVMYGLRNLESFSGSLIDRGDVSDVSRLVFVVFLGVLAGFTGITILAMMQLILFHSYLGLKKKTTYEFILERRKSRDKYKVSNIKVINENEAVEEVPLEEVFEPYVENPQFQSKETNLIATARISPEQYALPPISESDESMGRPNST